MSDVPNVRILLEVMEKAVPDDPVQRRDFVDWVLRELFEAAPDKETFLDHMDAAIERAEAREARLRPLQ